MDNLKFVALHALTINHVMVSLMLAKLTPDTPDLVRLVSELNNRIDVIITIMIFVISAGIAGIMCYILYRFILRFI